MNSNNFKVGTVALVGRPNVGKSTILNAILGQKVAAVSPRPQTTQTPVHAIYEDERGQIFFLDTPGLFKSKGRAADLQTTIVQTMREADLLVYVVDHTREWGHEEILIHDLVKHSKLPYILVINKADIERPSYKEQYQQQLADQAIETLEVSASRNKHLKSLLITIFENLPTGERNTLVDSFVTPILSHGSSEYLSEIIREKIYLNTEEEVPYQTSVRNVDTLEDESKNRLTIHAEIYVAHPRYKAMIIGKGGQKIKQIGKAVREELQIATNKQVVVKLTVSDK